MNPRKLITTGNTERVNQPCRWRKNKWYQACFFNYLSMRVFNFLVFPIIYTTISFLLIGCANYVTNYSSQLYGEEYISGSELKADVIVDNYVVWLTSDDAISMDPHLVNDIVSMVFMSQVYQGLVTIDQYGNIVPSLAYSFYTIAPNVWQFNLRQGIYFHDNTPFNSYAVVTSLNRLLNPAIASPGANILDMVTDIIAIDSYIVHIHTDFPFSPLPGHLASVGGFIVSPNAISKENDNIRYNLDNIGYNLNEAPVGTGPFLMYRRNHGYSTIFIRNENYWGQVPSIERIIFRVVPESSTRLAMLENREANAFVATTTELSSVVTIQGASYFTIYSATTEYIGFNLSYDNPLSNIYLRYAISNAINRKEILEMMSGLAIPAISMAGPQIAFSPIGLELQPFNIERARELILKTPYAQGITLNFYYTGTVRGQVAQLVQSYLAEIGITVNIIGLEWGALISTINAGSHDIFALSWSAGTGDADRSFHPLFHTSNQGSLGNRFAYSNYIVDDLLERARQTTDEYKRHSLYEEIAEILAHDLPIIPLWHTITPIVYLNIQGLQVDFRAIPDFRNVVLTG